MKSLISLRPLVSLLLSLLILTGGLVRPAPAQERKPINIRFGQPNIWSLEQAHYLLARMRSRNLGIQGQELADSDLDPNETTGTRLRQLRQSLGVGVGFDAVAGMSNEIFQEETRFKQERRQQLLTLRDQRQVRLVEITNELHTLQLDKERMKLAGAKDPELAFKQLEIDQKSTEKTQLENQITATNTELTGLSITATPAPVGAPTPQNGPTGDAVLDKLLNDQKFRDNIANDMPELNASTKLDNYLDFQTELIAKQLTLLRDELGPGERLIFLELPQSFYTVPDKSNRKVAQVWWHVDGYYVKPEEEAPAKGAIDSGDIAAFAGLTEECQKEIAAENAERNALRASETQRRAKDPAWIKAVKLRQDAEFQKEKEKAVAAGAVVSEAQLQKTAEDTVKKQVKAEIEAAVAEKSDPKAQPLRMKCNPYSVERPRERAQILKEIVDRQRAQYESKLDALCGWQTKDKDDPENLKKACIDQAKAHCQGLELPEGVERKAGFCPRDFEPADYFDVNAANENNGAIRTIDLIPRQSAFNVNDIQDKQKNFNLAGLFTFLSGFGARVDFQRQRRLYQQFITQDTYASAFGKGDSEFGWTFGPKPGTERIATGLHTTFAILVVPERAETVKLTARGCYFPRTAYAPNNFGDTNERSLAENASSVASLDPNVQCTADETFRLPIPTTTENNFWVTGIEYRPVRPGERAVVYVHGHYFSPQIGVLVDGVPLRQTVGLAQVALAGAPRDNGFQPSPRGDFEFVNSRLLVLAFTMPRNAKGEEYKGTPNIALVTPGRARIINDIRLIVNDSYKCTKETAADPEKKPDTNCPCLAYENDDRTKACKVFERYKRLPEPLGLSREESMFVELSDQPAIFSELPKTASLDIGDLKVMGTDANGLSTAYLTGSKFDPRDDMFVNGLKIEVTCAKPDPAPKAGAPVAAVPCVGEDFVAAAQNKPGFTRTCAISGTAVVCPNFLAKNLLLINFKATTEPMVDVTIIHHETGKEPQVASKQFRNELLPRVDRFTIVEYQKKNKPALLRLYLEGSGFKVGQEISTGSDDVQVRQVAVSPTTIALDLTLKEQVPYVRLTIGKDKLNPSASVVITLPVDPPEEENTTRRQQQQPNTP